MYIYYSKFAKDHLFDIAYYSPIMIILKSYFRTIITWKSMPIGNWCLWPCAFT